MRIDALSILTPLTQLSCKNLSAFCTWQIENYCYTSLPMIEFTLFGIRVRVFPMFWVGMALLGGALNIRETNQLLPVLLFVIAGAFCVLVHELGHAFAARYLMKSTSYITLNFFVAFTEFANGQSSNRWTRIWVSLAGPLSSLLPGALAFCLLAIFLAHGNLSLAMLQSVWLIFSPHYAFIMPQNFGGYGPENLQYFFLGAIMFTSVWWSLLNLLPVFPMDGGLVMADLLQSPRKTHLLSMILSAVFTLVAIVFFHSYLLAMFLAFFFILNLRAWQASRY